MTLRNFLTFNGAMFIPFGIVMLLIPHLFFPILAVNLDGDGLMMASMVGSMLLSFGLICWVARDVVQTSPALRALLIGNLTFHAIDSFLTGKAAATGAMNGLGFMFSAMHFVLAAGFGFFLWKLFNAVK